MGVVLTIGVWAVFISLCVYVFLSGKGGKLEDYTGLVRKYWYLILIFGFLVFITKNGPATLFTDWKNYLIVLVVFIVIDSLVFLELHFTKLGGQELKRVKVQVGITQEELDSVERKFGLIPIVLTNFEFMLYNLDKDFYITQLEEFLNGYAAEENLTIDLLPYGTDDEKERVLHDLGKSRDRAKRFLMQQRSIDLERETLTLYPFTIYDYDYVVQIQSKDEDNKITEVDGTVITTLIMTYDLTVSKNNNKGGEE